MDYWVGSRTRQVLMRIRLSDCKLVYLLCRKSEGKKKGEMRIRPMDWIRSTMTMTRISLETWQNGSRQNMYVDDKTDLWCDIE